MYASKKTKITCCSELRKWSPKTPFSGGVSCWHLPGLLTPSEGAVWVVLCWMAPSFPPTFEKKCKFLTYLESVSPWIFSFYENGSSKKISAARPGNWGGVPPQTPPSSARPLPARAKRAKRASRAIYLYTFNCCVNCVPQDSTLLRVFSLSTRSSEGVLFNKICATFQVSKTIN